MKKTEYFEALSLREKGYSLTEISNKTGISKGTVSGWVKDVQLSAIATERLKSKVTAGQIKSAQKKKDHTTAVLERYYRDAISLFQNTKYTDLQSKMFCVLVYWCEGGKHDRGRVQFTNSDPLLISTFLNLFRRSFKPDESKFRACLHLHEYHSAGEQIKYWSEITKIPTTQFIKPFIKKNGGRRIHQNYPGCIQIRYSDANTVRDLIMTGKALLENLGA